MKVHQLNHGMVAHSCYRTWLLGFSRRGTSSDRTRDSPRSISMHGTTAGHSTSTSMCNRIMQRKELKFITHFKQCLRLSCAPRLIRQIDAASTVLLKNSAGILPLKAPKTIAIIGNGAANSSKGANGYVDAARSLYKFSIILRKLFRSWWRRWCTCDRYVDG